MDTHKRMCALFACTLRGMLRMHVSQYTRHCTTHHIIGSEQPSLVGFTLLLLLLQVLCIANSGRQFLLHELLLCWHKELASSTPAAAATTISAPLAAAAAAHEQAGFGADTASSAGAAATDAKHHAKLVAFLLLMQHLAGFYKTEQQRFKQGLAATLRASAAAAGGAAAAGDDFAGSADAATAPAAASRAARKPGSDGQQYPQQLQTDVSTSPDVQQAAAGAQEGAGGAGDPRSNLGGGMFDYMLGEEERQWVEESTAKFTSGLLEETAPACYLPVLLQLLASADVPEHVKVTSCC
jgi:hypothetical protein